MKSFLFLALVYVSSRHSWVNIPTPLALIITFILTWLIFLDLFDFYCKNKGKWTHRMVRKYEKLPLIKRAAMIPVLKTELFKQCEYKTAAKSIIIACYVYQIISLSIIVYEFFVGTSTKLLESADLISNVYFIVSFAFAIPVFGYLIRIKKTQIDV